MVARGSYCFLVSLLSLSIHIFVASADISQHHIVVAGALNLDTFLPLERLPTEGENLTLLPGKFPQIDIPGGKGCNQAIACSKLSKNSNTVTFLGQFGNDEGASILRSALVENNVNLDLCGISAYPSGRGYVFLEKESGKVSAVVSGGSNLYGWVGWEHLEGGSISINEGLIPSLFKTDSGNRVKCILLQREIPEYVNKRLAQYAKLNGVMVIQDIGGEERPITSEMLSLCDYLVPNLSELKRMSIERVGQFEKNNHGIEADDELAEILENVRKLQSRGANHILVTMGEKGSVLVLKEGDVIFQKACELPEGHRVIDETGAGDCYRAGFAVAMSEGKKSLKECMLFASGAGALAVTKEGAVPSIPTRKEVENLLIASDCAEKASSIQLPSKGGDGNPMQNIINDSFPYLFGSRLNSMKDRPDLWPRPVDDVREWVNRQGKIKGIGCVDFNYPQHFHTWTTEEAKKALKEAGLVAGAVCLRYPAKFSRGAMNHPDEKLRREAIQLTKEAAEVAKELGCNEVVVWSAFDGYDYPFQVNYKDKWDQIAAAFQECCDEFPEIRWSLEFKPTDENTRFFTVPSTGAALLLVNEINRENMGLTLDVGHMLMAGENPGQSVSMVGGKLFGIQLNDGYTRLAAEDGMMFGSVHPFMALEVMWQLRRINFKGHLYFDTFPQRTDPLREAEYNIQKVKEFWEAAKRLDHFDIGKVMDSHDAIGALNAATSALKM